MAGAYEALNRLDEAKAIADEAVSRKLDGAGVHFVLMDLAYIRGDHAAVEHELDVVKGTGNEPFLLFFHANWLMSEGKVKASRPVWEKVRQMTVSTGAKDLAGNLSTIEAYDNAVLGNEAEARRLVSQALALSSDTDAQWSAAIVLAATGDLQKSAEDHRRSRAFSPGEPFSPGGRASPGASGATLRKKSVR